MSRCPWKLAYLIDFDHHRDTKTRFYVTLLNYDSPLIRDRPIEIIVSKEITYISNANAKKAITLSAGLIELSNKT